MKTIAFGILAACLGVTRVMAADIGLYGSHWDPEDGDDVWGGGVGLYFDTLPLELRVSYFGDVNVKGRDLDIIPVDVGFAVNLTRATAVDLYVGGGGSYYFVDAQEGGEVDNDAGWYLMARLEIPVDGGLSLFAEVMHRDTELDDINADLSGTAISAGVVFR